MKFDRDLALQLNAAIVGSIGAASVVAPKKMSEAVFASDHQVNNAGMMDFGLAMVGSAVGLCALSQTKDDKMKRNMLGMAAALHAGCAAISVYGKRKDYKTKKGAIGNIAVAAAGAGVSIAGVCMK